jgi:hypothetical protein
MTTFLVTDEPFKKQNPECYLKYKTTSGKRKENPLRLCHLPFYMENPPKDLPDIECSLSKGRRLNEGDLFFILDLRGDFE